MKAIKVLCVLLLIFAVVAAIAIFVPAEYFVARRSGEIDYYGDATRLELRRYEIIGRPQEIRSWLEQPHDGAFGTVIAINFLSWGLSHPRDFVLILEGINFDKTYRIVEWLGWMVDDMQVTDEFLGTFAQYDSPVITELKAQVEGTRR